MAMTGGQGVSLLLAGGFIVAKLLARAPTPCWCDCSTSVLPNLLGG